MAIPPRVAPSPTYTFLVSVVYSNSPSAGVTACNWEDEPLLIRKDIYYFPFYQVPVPCAVRLQMFVLLST